MPLENVVSEDAEHADYIAAIDADVPAQVQQTLADYLHIRLTECGDLDADVADAAGELAEFALQGGKRIRPTFAWWGWRAVGSAEYAHSATAVLRAASAVELIQTCALVHDDLIDGSATRRGNPTMHVRFAGKHSENGWTGQPRHFGSAAAILLGDLALSWADDMLHASGLDKRELDRALGAWQAMRTEVLAGQYLDVLGQARADESTDGALRIDQLKSASYTVERPLQFGAEIGGADPRTVTALRGFGADIGVAFQLRDDLLGVFGDPEVTGKPAGDDLREGKRTLLVAEGLQRARHHGDASAVELLNSVLGDEELTRTRVADARQALTRVGAVAAVEERIATLTDSAMSALRSVELSKPAATKLAELAIAATDRMA